MNFELWNVNLFSLQGMRMRFGLTGVFFVKASDIFFICVLCFLLGLSLGLPGAVAFSQEGLESVVGTTRFSKLSQIENQIYGHTYLVQSDAERIVRLEKTLLGASQRGALEPRMARLQQMAEDKNQAKNAETQKPIIEYLEEKLFQRTYRVQPMTERLSRLETHVFGRSFSNYPLNVRIKKMTYAMPLMAKEVRLTKTAAQDDIVVASTYSESRGRPKSNTHQDVQLLDAGKALAIAPVPSAVVSGDYSQSIYKSPSGTVLRWTRLPIKIYIKASQSEYGMTLQAVKAWQPAFALQLVDNAAAADVIVAWDKASWDQNSTGFTTRPVIHVDDKQNICTAILINMFPFHGLNTTEQLHGLSHQLGHAFGLWGHSEQPSDVMYPAHRAELEDISSRFTWRSALPSGFTNVGETKAIDFYAPSQRDINTLIKLYAQPATSLREYDPY